MSTLTALWLVSLILSGTALAIMIGLVVGRWIHASRARFREAERRRLIPLLLGTEPSPLQLERVEPAYDLLADIATDLIQMVRGKEKENFVASAARLGVPDRLRQRLERGSPRTRLLTVEALGHFEDEETVSRLHAALDDPNSDVRLSAAIALASAGRAPPARELVDRLGIGTREHSVLIVGLFEEIAVHDPAQVKALIGDESVNPAAKAAAIDALAASGDYSLVPLIANVVLAADPDAEQLPRYLRALGDFGHPAAAKAVTHALGSQVWWVRAAAAEAAGRIGLEELADRLAMLLSDAQWWVRFRAAEALTRMGDRGLLMLSETALSDKEPARSAARLTLAERARSS